MKFLSGRAVGIDLGTTFSSLAIVNQKGEPETVPNKEGGHITHSVVWLGDPTKAVVGVKAYEAVLENPDQVCQAIKREMGNETYKFEYGDVTVTPEAISAMILRKLKLDAEERLGEQINNAVITVPAYFNDVRRQATINAGEIAGLNVLEIINEPTAATLAYAWLSGHLGRDVSDKPRTVVVYDLGGGTFDVSAVQYQGTDFKVLATDGDVRLGGLDWTRRIVDDVAEQLIKQGAPDLRKDRRTMEMLYQRCEIAKRSLSARPRANIQIKLADKSYIAAVRREGFEQLAGDLMQRTRDTIESVLTDAKLESDDVDTFILVGGSTRMPAVVNMMREIAGREPYTGLSADEAVAQGAAIHAAILEAKYRDAEGSFLPAEVLDRLRAIQQTNVNSHSLGILARDPKTGQDTNTIMIPRNSSIPCSKTQRFVTREDNQERVRVRILEGDAPNPDACYEIGQCLISNLPSGLPAGAPIEVTYSYDVNGCIQVHAKDVTGGREATIEILRAQGMERAEIGKMKGVVSDLAVE